MTIDDACVPYFPLRTEQQGDRWKVRNPVDEESYWLNDYARYLLQLCDGFRTLAEITHTVGTQYGSSPAVCRERIKSVIDPLTEARMIWWRKQRATWWPTPPPQSIFWELTWQCNLRCRHCVVSAGQKDPGELTTDECQRLAEELARLGVRSAAFSGGEPLLRPDFFEIAEHVTRLGITTRLSTNGMLVDEGVAHRLRGLGTGVQITLNGSTAQTHDRFVGVPGAYDRAVRAVLHLTRAGLPVTLATVATRTTADDVPKTLELAVKLGVQAFRLIPFVPSGRGKHNAELELDPLEMKAVTKYLADRRGQTPIEIVPLEFEHTFSEPTGAHVDPLTKIGCSGAVSYCTIGATGDVLPCSYFAGVEAENVKDKPFHWIWSSSRFLNYFRSLTVGDIDGACGGCRWLSTCRTGCKAANCAKGDLFGSNCHCWIVREEGGSP
jgi:radical SAM protein with 4Fe4S-binding SPASM domain